MNKKDVYKNLIEDRSDDYKYGEALLKEVIPNITVIGLEAFYGIRVFSNSISDTKLLEESKIIPRNFFSNIKEIKKYGLSGVFYKIFEAKPMPYNSYVSFDSLEKLGDSALSNFHFTHVNFPKLSSIDLLYTALLDSYNLIWVRFDSLKEIKGTSLYQCLLDNRGNSHYKKDKLKAIVLSSDTLVTLNSSVALIGSPTNTVCPISPAYTGNNPGYIYVPKALVEEYKTATNWSVFADKFRAIEDYPEICNEGV